MPMPNEPPVRAPQPAPGGDDVLALAARGQGGMNQGQPQPGGQDPVMLARDVIGKLLQLKQMLPQLAPIVQEFLQKLSQVGGQAGGPPPPGGSPPGTPPPPGIAPEGNAPPPGM
jgi:hypothetical protein